MSIQVDCRDYAAYGELVLTASGSGYTSDPVVVKIPKDDNGNKIADCWGNDASTPYDPEADNDQGPNINNCYYYSPADDSDRRWLAYLNGDGITVLDEYRGLNVRGTWTETDPDTWDVFIVSCLGIGDAWALPSMTLHEMERGEVYIGDGNMLEGCGDLNGGIVYHNRIGMSTAIYGDDGQNSSSHGDVYALKLSDDMTGGTGTTLGKMPLGPPSAASQGTIYTGRIVGNLYTSPQGFNYIGYLDTVIAHEIGHGVSLPHCPDLDHPNCYMWRFADPTNEYVNRYRDHHDIDYDLRNPALTPQDAADDDGSDRKYSEVLGHYFRLFGDVNSDDVVNRVDVLIVMSNLNTTREDKTRTSDVNWDGQIDENDLALVTAALENMPVVVTEPLPEDVNGDGVVNTVDLVMVASSFGDTRDEHEIFAVDVNGDCAVNILDLVMVALAFGNTVAVPE